MQWFRHQGRCATIRENRRTYTHSDPDHTTHLVLCSFALWKKFSPVQTSPRQTGPLTVKILARLAMPPACRVRGQSYEFSPTAFARSALLAGIQDDTTGSEPVDIDLPLEWVGAWDEQAPLHSLNQEQLIEIVKVLADRCMQLCPCGQRTQACSAVPAASTETCHGDSQHKRASCTAVV